MASTTLTNAVLGSYLELGRDVNIALSPERIDPGDATYGVANTPKVVGGLTPQCTSAARDFYAEFIDTVVETKGAKEAEMAKLLENTFRHVNIALVNEMLRFCDDLDIDLWDAIDCAKVLLLGVTYKPNISDRRQRPADPLARRLLSWGAELSYHDPFVPTWSLGDGAHPGALTCVEDVYQACALADIVVLLQPHRQYDLGRLVAESPVILDTGRGPGPIGLRRTSVKAAQGTQGLSSGKCSLMRPTTT